MAAGERVTPRAALGVGFVIGHVLMTGHARRTIGVYLVFVNVVASLAFGVAFALQDV